VDRRIRRSGRHSPVGKQSAIDNPSIGNRQSAIRQSAVGNRPSAMR
jgi:hypothetical protein